MPTVDLTWLGQAGFLLEAGTTRILIDPWLSPAEGRLVEPAPFDSVSDRIDGVLITHEHTDHFDLPFLRRLAARSPRARLVLPEPIADQADTVLSIEPVRPGDRVQVGGMVVDVVSSCHGVDMRDAYTEGGGRFVGFVIDAAGTTLYHPGDTVTSAALLSALDGRQIDVALLPVNGRDSFREADGIVGNLDAREAARLASHLGAHTLVPYHWDGFAGNTERPGRVVDEAATIGAVHVLCLARHVAFRLG